jgi:hypothetical protein
MFYCRGAEDLSFKEAIHDNMKRIEAGINFNGEKGERLWHEQMRSWWKKIRFRTYIDFGYYAQQLARYFALFPKSQIKIMFFEDLVHDPQSIATELWDFIGVDSSFPLKDTAPVHVSYNTRTVGQFVQTIGRMGILKLVPRSMRVRFRNILLHIGRKPKMNPEIRAWLIEHYHEHNRALEELLSCDLSHWDR